MSLFLNIYEMCNIASAFYQANGCAIIGFKINSSELKRSPNTKALVTVCNIGVSIIYLKLSVKIPIKHYLIAVDHHYLANPEI